jgi:hypothetical protein
MNPTTDSTLLDSSFNAFKNSSVQHANFNLPASLAANQNYSQTVTFKMSLNASFLQAYVFSTDYQYYFDFLDSQYHDNWRLINANADHLCRSSGSLLNFQVNMYLVGNLANFTLYLRGLSSATTILHPTFLIPITFIDYTLAN